MGAGLAAGWPGGVVAAEKETFRPDGAALYQKHCAVCHGERGDGRTRARRGLDPPPRDFTTARAREELSRERMIASVTHGRPGTAMMPFAGRLSAAEIEAVVDYIHQAFMQGAPNRGLPPHLARGERIYTRHCAVCHGDRGSGALWTRSSLNPPPRDFTTARAREELSRERMIASVTHGRPGTAMMPFGGRLSEADIEAVVDYIRATFMQGPTPEPLATRLERPFPKGLRGDPEAGRRLYRANCTPCHGERGDGRGPRASSISPPPRNFLASEARARLDRPALFRAVRDGLQGTVMPAWGKVLTEQQIADVAEYIFQAFLHPDAGVAKKNP